MKDAIEKEYKVIVTKEEFYRLANFYKPLKFVKQTNYYYECKDSSHYGFRIREKENEKLFTLKEYAAGEVREYEKILTEPLEKDQEITSLLAQKNIFQPYKVFGELTTYRAVYFDGYGELCFDINFYNNTMDYEIEYEQIKEHQHFAEFFRILSQANIEYVPSFASKYKRCLISMKEERK
ncbi:MAG: CYTH domain-containing protein [Erysipelotrichia bacterium]|nr:CYTH domain-containing protein [Erysipelotrichia bacterium]